MKKLIVAITLVLFVATAFSAGPKVLNLINGTLGDKSFFDSAERGVKMIEEKLGLETKTIEMSYNPAEWTPTLEDMSDSGEFDIIIVGTWQMVDALAEIAPYYPEITYIIYDTSMPFENGNLDNVYAMTYKQNEGSFLAGALAAMVSEKADLPYSNPDSKRIGLLGGMDIAVINDFLVGYIEGAQYIDPEMKVSTSYVGAWNDPAKGKEFTMAMYRQKADVVFAVAGETGNGVLEAAKEMGKWSLGVDSDMQLIYQEKDMEIVNHMLTSMLKNVDASVFRAVEKYLNGTLPMGQEEALGIAEGAVGLAENKYFDAFLDANPEIKDQLEDIKAKILDGTITVTSALGLTNEELNAIRDAAK
ncbi:MAG TPA: BMP family ABC transporter substrate-binding protein [Thermotogota bacterium]|nr:BMP family ABC transporter substrate-binding protein [Thermotogota bacterium]